ncbi:MAG: DUF4160 domain-containing protein [Candidatus Aureabacteria bacterium]|nr:DUF4160 domain-containing protein [Candidatus Auribacterota bacterium]
MPTIIFLNGWRLFFYANEKGEPMHIHGKRGNSECKYWIDEENFELFEAFSYNMTPNDKRQVKKIIFMNFDYIVLEWKKYKESLR